MLYPCYMLHGLVYQQIKHQSFKAALCPLKKNVLFRKYPATLLKAAHLTLCLPPSAVTELVSVPLNTCDITSF